MITFDSTTNIGFDFDVNIEVNARNDEYSPEEIRHIIIKALNKIITRQGFNYVENGTRVLTIKKVNSFLSKLQYSCDIAIVKNYIDRKDGNHQEYVRYIKAQNTYIWAEQTSPYDLEEKIKAIKNHNLWNDVRKLYLYKKNYNTDKNKKSRNLYAETIKEIHDRI